MEDNTSAIRRIIVSFLFLFFYFFSNSFGCKFISIHIRLEVNRPNLIEYYIIRISVELSLSHILYLEKKNNAFSTNFNSIIFIFGEDVVNSTRMEINYKHLKWMSCCEIFSLRSEIAQMDAVAIYRLRNTS